MGDDAWSWAMPLIAVISFIPVWLLAAGVFDGPKDRRDD